MLNGIPRILVVRLSAIGDVVRVLPAVQALREAHPNAQIDWAVERKSADVVEGHPALDRVLVFERPPGRIAAMRAFTRFCRRVRASRYDVVVDFHGIFKSGLLSRASGAPERHGFARPRGQEGSPLAANRRVTLTSQDLNRVDENLQLIHALAPEPARHSVPIQVPEDVQTAVDAYVRDTFGSDKLLAAIHVPVERPEKQWPPERFAKVADLLAADGRFDVLFTWGPGQAGIVHEALRRTRSNPAMAPETPDLKHYAWLMHRCQVYIGGDTGPMHIAAAMGTPVVAVFGGTDPRKHRPYGAPSEILYAGGTGRGLEAARRRLDQITAEDVYDATVRLVTWSAVAYAQDSTNGAAPVSG